MLLLLRVFSLLLFSMGYAYESHGSHRNFADSVDAVSIFSLVASSVSFDSCTLLDSSKSTLFDSSSLFESSSLFDFSGFFDSSNLLCCFSTCLSKFHSLL